MRVNPISNVHYAKYQAKSKAVKSVSEVPVPEAVAEGRGGSGRPHLRHRRAGAAGPGARRRGAGAGHRRTSRDQVPVRRPDGGRPAPACGRHAGAETRLF